MKLNKKYFLALFTALGIQAIFGANLANAVPCEDVIERNFEYNGTYDPPTGKVWEFLWSSGAEGDLHVLFTSVEDAKNKLYETAKRYTDSYKGNNARCVEDSKYRIDAYFKLIACMSEVLVNNGCDPSVFKKDGAIPQSNSSKSKSNQSSSSGASSGQSNSASSNQSSQQNSSPEEVERSNMKNNYAEKTAAYEQKYQGRGKKHNHGAVANQCIKTKGRKVLNICDFDVEAVFCAVNPDPDSIHAFETASAFNCAKNTIGMWPISARKPLSGVFTADSVSVFACKKPSHPSGAVYDHQKQVIVARCSEY